MAVVIKKKPKAPESQGDTALLQELGLVPDQKVQSIAQTVPDGPKSVPIGAKVFVNHDLYPWIKSYGRGDTGVVKAIFLCKDYAPGREAHDLFTVALDNPRNEMIPEVDLHRWEIELVKE